MIFMQPESVVLLIQQLGTRDYYASMAYGSGHYCIPFLLACMEDTRAHGKHEGASARFCRENDECTREVNNQCVMHVDLATFLPVFANAFSYAFRMVFAQMEIE